MQNVRVIRYDPPTDGVMTAEVLPADRSWSLRFTAGKAAPTLWYRVNMRDQPSGEGWICAQDIGGHGEVDPDTIMGADVPTWDEMTPEEQAQCEAAAEQYARLGHCRIVEAAP